MTYNQDMGSKTIQRRLREKAILKESILDAARNLLVKDGYAAISIRAVADAIEYSPATLYLHFTDREAILTALAMEGFNSLADRMKAATEANVFDRMVSQGLQYLDFAVQNPRLYELMFISRDLTLFASEGDAVPDGPECFQILHEAVAEAQTVNVLRSDLPVPVLAYSIWGTVHGMASLAVSDRLDWLPKETHEVLFRETARAAIIGFQP